ncbi:MAG: hypothetical protein CO189_12335 [candidate division Zixibacteria bacterium CG_4_9_14_3_um_filter_46_8]|nr:MAG: hypothetical protein CO189_12335 [candidate division Zixibacteria bacterium CG_4_9_14_3_um_filter_46_8]
MRGFWRFALMATVATYLLIFIGGVVRVSGAGLGCPDWPKCFGRWLPPTNMDQLPPNIDPSQFNFTLAWIEYFNRLCGVAVGVLILITAIWALKSFRKFPKILYPALAAAVLVALEGWQGGILIALELQPLAVTIHAVLALIIVSLLIYLTAQAYYLENAPRNESVYPKKINYWIGSLWILAVIQILLGTQIRSSIEIIRAQYPLLSELEWLSKVGGLKHLHVTLGFLVAGITGHVGSKIISKSSQPFRIVIQSAWAAIFLVSAQLLVGLILLFVGLPPLMEVFHLWLASLYVGVILVNYSALKASSGE